MRRGAARRRSRGAYRQRHGDR